MCPLVMVRNTEKLGLTVTYQVKIGVLTYSVRVTPKQILVLLLNYVGKAKIAYELSGPLGWNLSLFL